MSLDKSLKSTVRVLETVKHCSTGTYFLFEGDHDVARHGYAHASMQCSREVVSKQSQERDG